MIIGQAAQISSSPNISRSTEKGHSSLNSTPVAFHRLLKQFDTPMEMLSHLPCVHCYIFSFFLHLKGGYNTLIYAETRGLRKRGRRASFLHYVLMSWDVSAQRSLKMLRFHQGCLLPFERNTSAMASIMNAFSQRSGVRLLFHTHHGNWFTGATRSLPSSCLESLSWVLFTTRGVLDWDFA